MRMTDKEKDIPGDSDTQGRFAGGLVPAAGGPSHSVRSDEFSEGLPRELPASTLGADAIAEDTNATMEVDLTEDMGQERKRPGPKSKTKAGPSRETSPLMQPSLPARETRSMRVAAKRKLAEKNPRDDPEPEDTEKRAQIQRTNSMESVASSSSAMSIGEGGAEVTLTEIEAMDSNTIGACIHEWAMEVDRLRVKSGNIQGKIQHEMKKRLHRISEAAMILTARLSSAATTDQIRNENRALQPKVNTLTAENMNLRKEQRETRNTRSTTKKTEESPVTNTMTTGRGMMNRQTQVRQESERQETRDPMLTRIMEDMQEIKEILGITRESRKDMPPPRLRE